MNPHFVTVHIHDVYRTCEGADLYNNGCILSFSADDLRNVAVFFMRLIKGIEREERVYCGRRFCN